MTCPPIETLMAPDAAAREHIDTCVACTRRLDAIRRTTSQIRPGQPAGPCPDLSETHVADCDACQDLLRMTAEDAPDVSADLLASARSLGPRSVPLRRRSTFARRRTTPSYVVPLAAAAAVVVAIIGILIATSDNETPQQIVQPEQPAPQPERDRPELPPLRPLEQPEVVQQPEPEPLPEPEPEPEIVQQPEPEPAPQPEPQLQPEPEIVQQVEREVRDESGTTEGPAPEPAVLVARIDDIRGALLRGTEALTEPIEVVSADALSTPPQDRARFLIDGTYEITAREGSSWHVEPAEDETRIVLESGEVFARVPPGSRTLRVTTEHADAVVHGTAFSVRLEGNFMILTVEEGTVEMTSGRRSVMVEAFHRAAATRGRISRPERVDPIVLLAWTRDPRVTGQMPTVPVLDTIPAPAATGFRGLVVSAPYADWETGACDVGRQAAEQLGAGIVIGYRWRNYEDERWMAIDRGSERLYDEQGNRADAYTQTEPAMEVYRRWLDHMRAASGDARNPAPMIVAFRNHSENAANGESLAVIEVSANGIDADTERRMRETYERLIAQLNPTARLDIRFDQLDGTYEYAGETRTFMFTESDAKTQGYMEAQYARRALCFFYPTSALMSEDDARIYARISAEMIRVAWRR